MRKKTLGNLELYDRSDGSVLLRQLADDGFSRIVVQRAALAEVVSFLLASESTAGVAQQWRTDERKAALMEAAKVVERVAELERQVRGGFGAGNWAENAVESIRGLMSDGGPPPERESPEVIAFANDLRDSMMATAAKAAARALTAVILDSLQADPHQWSARPCPTCRSVSALAGRDFGCSLVAKGRADRPPPAPTTMPGDGKNGS